MRIRIVANLVDAEVGSTRRLLRATLDEDDVAPLPERRHEQRGIVGNPGALRWHRAEERDSHDSNLADRAIPGDLEAPALALFSRRRRPRPDGREATPPRRGSLPHRARRRGPSSRRARRRVDRRRRRRSAPACRRGTTHAGQARSPRRTARRRWQSTWRRAGATSRSRPGPVKRTRAGDAAIGRQCVGAGRDQARRPTIDDCQRGASAAAASISRSIRLARSRRLTERMKSPWPFVAVVELLGRVRSTSATRPVERWEPSRHVSATWRTSRVASPSETRSSSCTRRRSARSSADRPNWPEDGAVELVRLPELVHHRTRLSGWRSEIGRELRRNDHVDGPAVGLGEVDESPEKGLRAAPVRPGTT